VYAEFHNSKHKKELLNLKSLAKESKCNKVTLTKKNSLIILHKIFKSSWTAPTLTKKISTDSGKSKKSKVLIDNTLTLNSNLNLKM
jgi:hypothetical protein